MYRQGGKLHRPSSQILVDGQVVQDLRMCCHCGRHFPIRSHDMWFPGRARAERRETRMRGYCSRCHGYVCGPGCAECRPYEQRLEEIEAKART